MKTVAKVRVLGGDDELFNFPSRQLRSKLGEVVELLPDEVKLLTKPDGSFDGRFTDPPVAGGSAPPAKTTTFKKEG